VRDGDFYIAAKGGHNKESHNHNDVGTFMAFDENSPVLVDAGIGTYTKQTFSPERYKIPAMQSAYHNLPLINGVMQKEGKEYAADGFSLEDKTVTVSFANAYPDAAGVKKAIRKISIVKDGVNCTDEFEFTKDNLVAEHFITPLDVEIDGDSAILGGKYILTVKGATVTTDTLEFNGDMKFITVWERDNLNRVKFELSSDRVEITLRRK
jgi:hypothetical protein